MDGMHSSNATINNDDALLPIENATFADDPITINGTQTTTAPTMPTTTATARLTAANQLSLDSLGHEIEQALHNPAYLLVMHINMCVLFGTLLAIVVLLRKFLRDRIMMHGNLLVSFWKTFPMFTAIFLQLLFANIILLYAVHNFANLLCLLRYRVSMLYFFCRK